MARIMVFKHVAAEPLGLLDPMIRRRGHRIRYVNFHRDPDAQPRLERYRGLVVLGGPMQVTDTRRHPHLLLECRVIERALQQELPVLGICLGAQLLAHVLGARVGPAPRPEIGWYTLRPTPETVLDPVLAPLERATPVFQWHSYGFDLPDGVAHLAAGDDWQAQAFRAGRNAWGFQFHLELDQRLIRRWLNAPHYVDELNRSGLQHTPETILADTQRHLDGATALAERVFGNWLDRLERPVMRRLLPSR